MGAFDSWLSTMSAATASSSCSRVVQLWGKLGQKSASESERWVQKASKGEGQLSHPCRAEWDRFEKKVCKEARAGALGSWLPVPVVLTLALAVAATALCALQLQLQLWGELLARSQHQSLGPKAHEARFWTLELETLSGQPLEVGRVAPGSSRASLLRHRKQVDPHITV